MLGVSDQVELTPPEWASLAVRANLPTTDEEFFGRQGPTPVNPDTRRRFHRMFLRTQAVLKYRGDYLAAYLTDLSRAGVGLVSPVQLLPCETIELWLQDGRHLTVYTARCIRVDTACYNCGGVFKLGEA